MARPTLGTWIRWVLLTEIMLWILAVLGPIYRTGTVGENQGFMARILTHDPTFVHAVLLNALYLHLFLGLVLLGVRVTRRDGKNRGSS